MHEAALARGVKVVGATVHFVDEGTDTGPIILQKAVEVEQGDTPEMLQRRSDGAGRVENPSGSDPFDRERKSAC